MRNLFIAFIAGFLATLGFHQPVLWVLNAAGVVDRAPYAMEGVPPFGVPAVISLAFWGGVWGMVLWMVVRNTKSRAAYWLTAIVFGAIAPTLVAGTIVARLKEAPVAAGNVPKMLAIGLSINAAWGAGTALLIAVMRTRRREVA